MSNIREFRNADLPGLVNIWIAHWSRVGAPPQASAAILEQAVLSRTFFDASTLLILEQDDSIQGWCHYLPNPANRQATTLAAICFTDVGRGDAGRLIRGVESGTAAMGRSKINVGVVRDQRFGYAGLSPLGHGFGIPVEDQATAALLTDHGYIPRSSVDRMSVDVSTFRMPVSRDALQFRRGTQVKRELVIVEDPRRASALSHLDIERHTLFDQRTNQMMPSIDFWVSDPEAQVMRSDGAIVDLTPADGEEELTPPQKYLIGAVIQSMVGGHIRTIETAVDSNRSALLDQLAKLNFHSVGQGTCWEKNLG